MGRLRKAGAKRSAISWPVWALYLLIVGLVLGSSILATAAIPSSRTTRDTTPPVIVVLPVSGTIEPGLYRFLQRGLARAAAQGADAVLAEIDTFGGRVDAATQIRDLFLSSEIPVHAFVSRRAWSAGALIALSAERIVMSPESSIGAAEPRPAEEKTISALRAEFEATAESRGRDPRIAAAMVDASVAIKGVVETGKILTLSAKRAKELQFIEAVAEGRDRALESLGFKGPRVIEIRPSFAERVARFITDPTVSQLLLTIGFLGVLYELVHPGWGVGGTIGLSALGLFFGGHLVAGLAGWEVLILFAVGLILLAVEAFVLPGFGVAGAAGLIGILTSLFLTFGDPTLALQSVLIALAGAAILFALTFRLIAKKGGWRRVVLTYREVDAEGFLSANPRDDLVGRTGVALTPLRPAGVIQVGERRVDAVSEGQMIPPGTRLQVVEVQGNRVVVRET